MKSNVQYWFFTQVMELSFVQVIVSIGWSKQPSGFVEQPQNYPRLKCAYSVTNQVPAASLYSQSSSEDKLRTWKYHWRSVPVSGFCRRVLARIRFHLVAAHRNRVFVFGNSIAPSASFILSKRVTRYISRLIECSEDTFGLVPALANWEFAGPRYKICLECAFFFENSRRFSFSWAHLALQT